MNCIHAAGHKPHTAGRCLDMDGLDAECHHRKERARFHAKNSVTHAGTGGGVGALVALRRRWGLPCGAEFRAGMMPPAAAPPGPCAPICKPSASTSPCRVAAERPLPPGPAFMGAAAACAGAGCGIGGWLGVAWGPDGGGRGCCADAVGPAEAAGAVELPVACCVDEPPALACKTRSGCRELPVSVQKYDLYRPFTVPGSVPCTATEHLPTQGKDL